jgi:hypothetical protein
MPRMDIRKSATFNFHLRTSKLKTSGVVFSLRDPHTYETCDSGGVFSWARIIKLSFEYMLHRLYAAVCIEDIGWMLQ